MTQLGGRTHDQLGLGPAFTLDTLLGAGPLAEETCTDALVAGLVADALGIAVQEAQLEVVAYPFGSPATAALLRLVGTREDGAPWSLFCKVLQSPRHWPLLDQLPPPARRQFVEEFPWRCELELWDPLVQATLPPGLRAPRLHRVVELGDDRVAVWMEDVQEAPPSSDPGQFDRAAYLLGRWNARSTAPEVLSACVHPPGYALRMYAEQAVPLRGLGPLRDDGLWSHPWLARHAGLRGDLLALGERIPELLDRLDTLPQTMPHGDASPQNLLVPADEPDTLVVIDISFRSPHALGFDLGQLLVGLTHAGLVPAAMLPEVAARILPAYLAGLRDDGIEGLDEEVGYAFAAVALLRSGFDSFLYGLMDDPTEANAHTFAERVVLCRFLADRALEVLDA